MKLKPLFPALACTGLMLAAANGATVFNDATGEEFSGNAILDIASVEVFNDATDISFTVTVQGDPTTATGADWGKYLVAIDSKPGGDTTGNGWNRPISMASGMDYWIGSWVDSGGGAQSFEWEGAAWSAATGLSAPVVTTSSVTLTTSLASLGLSEGDSFVFDVFSAGGNTPDSANDALSDPSQSIADWGGPYNSESTLTFTVIPEPSTMVIGVLGLAGLIGLRRRRS